MVQVGTTLHKEGWQPSNASPQNSGLLWKKKGCESFRRFSRKTNILRSNLLIKRFNGQVVAEAAHRKTSIPSDR